MLSGYCDLTF